MSPAQPLLAQGDTASPDSSHASPSPSRPHRQNGKKNYLTGAITEGVLLFVWGFFQCYYFQQSVWMSKQG